MNESDVSGADKEGDEKEPMSIGRCVWPEKPRLQDDKFKEYRAECRNRARIRASRFLVGTCKDAACTRSHETPAAFEGAEKKFR